jgi:hypothetical protein
LGRSLPQVFRSVSVIVSPCWLRLPASQFGEGDDALPKAYFVDLRV